LESLVGRAYGEIHETRDQAARFSVMRWFFSTFPQTFRKHIRAFWLSLVAMAVGCALGGFLIGIDPASKFILMPFPHLQGDPSERVAQEEAVAEDRMGDAKASYSSYLMTHNTRVSIFTLALGITWGIGTALMLFYNGVILGAVFLDYITAGESLFLFGWLLPHGAIEIPSILLAGQAGFVLASAIIGWGRSVSLKMRLRMVTPDLVTLICGVAAMLLWAGIIEAFFSQYHEPVISYGIKVGFGILELLVLVLFLAFSGRELRGDSKMPFKRPRV
jgi:uncharacterized membrane protein SpoIIM required for sporulation